MSSSPESGVPYEDPEFVSPPGKNQRQYVMVPVEEYDALRRPAQGTQGCADIAAERQRQISEEGWTAERDDHYWHGKLASAALCYVYAGIFGPHDRDAGFVQRYWPWHSQWWKPSDTRRNLVKAGALVAAEIDRLDRASALPSTEAPEPTPDLARITELRVFEHGGFRASVDGIGGWGSTQSAAIENATENARKLNASTVTSTDGDRPATPVSMTELASVIYNAGTRGTNGVAEAILRAFSVTRPVGQPIENTEGGA